jgi:hypothetical protein
LDNTWQGFPINHVIERSKGIINVSKRRRRSIIFVFVSTATTTATAPARRRNGVGVFARQK